MVGTWVLFIIYLLTDPTQTSRPFPQPERQEALVKTDKKRKVRSELEAEPERYCTVQKTERPKRMRDHRTK